MTKIDLYELEKEAAFASSDTIGTEKILQLIAVIRIQREALEKINRGQGSPLGGSQRSDSYPALIRLAEEALEKVKELIE